MVHHLKFTTSLTSRFAVLLQQHGLGHNDVVHMVVGNNNLAYSVAFGCWILGGITSMGDVNLEARSIALQVNIERPYAYLLVNKKSALFSWMTQMPR